MRKILLSIFAMIIMLISVLFIHSILDSKINYMNLKEDETIAAISMTDYDSDICNHSDDTFCSHLPLVLIETDGQAIKKEETIWSSIKIIDHKNYRNHITDTPEIDTASTIKYRGNSSYTTFDKKQFRLEFYKKAGGTKKQDVSIMGMPKESDWVLYGPFLDRTLVRCHLLFGLSREIMEWAPDTRYCEVFLDGKFQGLYLMTESIKVSENRINLKDYSLLSGETSYLLKREGYGTEINPINNFGAYSCKTLHELSIAYPRPDNLLANHKEWINKDVSMFERVLYSDQFDDDETGYAAYIDVDSFVDYYIINEFSLNPDAGSISTYIYKDLDGKLKLVVWDFNSAFNGNAWNVYYPDEFIINNKNWFNRLLQDRNFSNKVIKRYHQLRKGVLSEAYLIGTIDETVNYLGSAVNRNFEVWGYTFYESLLGRDDEGADRDPKCYEEALLQLKTCIIERGDFLDKNIDYLYRYAIN